MGKGRVTIASISVWSLPDDADNPGSVRCGTLRCACWRRRCAAMAEGFVVDGCARDVAALAQLLLGEYAVVVHPMKTDKRGLGEVDVPVSIAGVDIVPGQRRPWEHYPSSNARFVVPVCAETMGKMVLLPSGGPSMRKPVAMAVRDTP